MIRETNMLWPNVFQTSRGSIKIWSKNHQQFGTQNKILLIECRFTQNVTESHENTTNCVLWNTVQGQTAWELLQHKSKFCSLTTCNYLTADSPSLSLAWFQTMPTHKTSHNQSESFSCSPTAVRSWPGSNHHAGLTFGKHWDLRRMWPWSMKQRGREEEEESKQIHYTARGLCRRQASQMLNGTEWLAFGCWGIISACYCDKQFV